MDFFTNLRLSEGADSQVGWACILRAGHCLVDGIAFSQVVANLCDLTADVVIGF